MCVCVYSESMQPRLPTAVIGQFSKTPHYVYWQRFHRLLPVFPFSPFSKITFSRNNPALQPQLGSGVVVVKKNTLLKQQ